MWTPADATALPTAEDLINAKMAIEIVKTELEDALIALAQAQLRVHNIEKDLRGRRAWIAPVRKLSLDVLSLIFEFCGEDHWKTALRIAGVSRLWRDVALSTPRAWSFIDLKNCNSREITQTFFERSGQRPLHIFLPYDTSLTFLSNVVHRIQCLSVEGLDYDSDQISFPSLARLTIRGDSNLDVVPLSDIGMNRFPVLRHLICESGILRGVGPSPAIAPLHTLSLSMTQEIAWLDFLKSCEDTLSSLRLHLIYTPMHRLVTQIVLSNLKCLEIQYWETEPDLWPLTLATPSLDTYKERGETSNNIPIHEDVRKVKFLCLDDAPTLSTFPMLVVLQLQAVDHLDDVLSQLTKEATLCPELTRIEVAVAVADYFQIGEFDGQVAEVNKRRPLKEITVVSGLSTPLPGIIAESGCGEGMPCSS